MKNKGFTLIELLAVLILLGIVTLIAVPAIGKIIDKSKKRALVGIEGELISVAKKYYTENLDELPSGTNSKCLSVNDLLETGFITNDEVIDPTTKKPLEGFVKTEYLEKYSQYEYTFVKECNNADG